MLKNQEHLDVDELISRLINLMNYKHFGSDLIIHDSAVFNIFNFYNTDTVFNIL